MPEYVPAADAAGALDEADTHYAVTGDGLIPHIYVGPLNPGDAVWRRAECGEMVARLAHPSETENRRLCLRCARSYASRTAHTWIAGVIDGALSNGSEDDIAADPRIRAAIKALRDQHEGQGKPREERSPRRA